MHSSVMRSSTRFAIVVAVSARSPRAGPALPPRQPVDAVTAAARSGAARAQPSCSQGQRDSATELLGRHLSQQPNDGRAWFYLGSIYLAEAQRWHRAGHPPETSGALAARLRQHVVRARAGTADRFGRRLPGGRRDRARHAAHREGRLGQHGDAGSLPADEVPLPPVLVELGQNLLASCPQERRAGHRIAGRDGGGHGGSGCRANAATSCCFARTCTEWDPRYRAADGRGARCRLVADLPAALAAAARIRPDLPRAQRRFDRRARDSTGTPTGWCSRRASAPCRTRAAAQRLPLRADRTHRFGVDCRPRVSLRSRGAAQSRALQHAVRHHRRADSRQPFPPARR